MVGSHRTAGQTELVEPVSLVAATPSVALATEDTHGRHMAMAALGYIVPPVAAIASAPILARSLGVVGRGDVAAATAPLLLAASVATFGVPDALTFYLARDLTRARHYLRLARILLAAPAVAATAVLVGLTPVLSTDQPRLAELMIVSSCALPVVLGVLILRAVAAGQHRWRLVAGEQIVSAIIRLAVLVSLFLFGRLTLLEATILTAAALYAGGVVYLRPGLLPAGTDPDSHPRPSPRPLVGVSTMMRYGARVWLGSISGVILLRLDQTLMTPLSGAAQLGLYAVAVNVSEVTLVFNNAIRDVSFVANAQQQSMPTVTRSARLSGAVSLLLASVIAACVPFGVPFVFGAGFDKAVPATLLLLVAVATGTPGSVAGAALSGRGHPGKRSTSLAIAAVVNIVLLFALVPRYGAIGAAWATLVGNLTASNANIVFLCRMCRISPAGFYGLRRTDLSFVGRAARRRRSGATAPDGPADTGGAQ